MSLLISPMPYVSLDTKKLQQITCRECRRAATILKENAIEEVCDLCWWGIAEQPAPLSTLLNNRDVLTLLCDL